MKSSAVLIFLFACGGGGGGNAPDSGDGSQPADAHLFSDAPPVVSQMIKFSGVTSESTNTGDTPLASVTVGVYASSNEATPLAMTVSDATGHYSLSVPSNGSVIDGFVKATKSGYADNYAYPAAPFATDQTANPNMITTSNFGYLGILGGQQASDGLIVIEILDASDMSVQGAKVTSSPASGSYRYMDAGGTPTSTSGTNTDGAAFAFNVPAGQVTVSATKSGMTFKTHGLVSHPGAFTTTVITP